MTKFIFYAFLYFSFCKSAAAVAAATQPPRDDLSEFQSDVPEISDRQTGEPFVAIEVMLLSFGISCLGISFISVS